MDERRRGRPPLDRSGTPSASVHLKLRAEDYDRATQLARDQRSSVQDVIRQALTDRLRLDLRNTK